MQMLCTAPALLKREEANMMLGDTVAAISTPRGKGGVGMIRVSGARAVEICENVFLPKNGKALSQIPARTAVYGSILAKETDGKRISIDDGIATVFRAPASFTGEDTVEITCHGGILLCETVLAAVIASGARAAEAGEFTRRAFLSGKLGLSEAEALGDLLEAKTHAQMKLAHAGMRGKLSLCCKKIYDRLCAVLAEIYVKIDYPDEDLAETSAEEAAQRLEEIARELEALADTYKTGHAVAEGIATVICGRPNAGKSSLYNLILGREAAIVTEVEGTTRDVLCETVAFGDVTLRLFDTAGLHETEDPVEQIGIERAHRAMEEAELILAVFDTSVPPVAGELDRIKQIEESGVSVIAVLNKSDLGTSYTEEYAAQFKNSVSVSAKNGEGIELLRMLVAKLFLEGSLDLYGDAVVANARQYGAVLSALESVRHAATSLVQGYPLEIGCADAEAAMESISALDGRAVSEDIVSEIFSHFCVGK